MTTPNTETNQLPRGKQDDYVLLHPSGRGWEIHKGSIGDGTDYTLTIHMMRMGRTADGEWWMGIRPDKDADWSDHITVDDPGAIAFLDTFADLITNLHRKAAYGHYRWSDLTARDTPEST